MFGRNVLAWANAINANIDVKEPPKYSSTYATSEAYKRQLNRKRRKYQEMKDKEQK